MSEYNPAKLIESFRQNVGSNLLSEELMKIKRLQRELNNARNELCLKCGQYENAHLGACDGCRYRHGGEWSADLDE